MKYILFFLLNCTISFVAAQFKPAGIFEHHQDVGKPKKAGSILYDENTQFYSIKGAGYNIWFGRDEFQYAFKRMKGDFILTANFEFVGTGVDPHRKIGWMVRGSLDEDAAHYSAVLHGDGLTVLQWRLLKGADMRDPEDEIFAPKKNYQILQIERIGKKLIMRAAHPGEPLQQIGTTIMDHMKDEVLAGLFICSHNEDAIEEARVWNVRIDKPVPESYNVYRDGFIGSRLEIMRVADGTRKVIHEDKNGFEAPNFLPGGKHLLFNQCGSLYKISVDGGVPEKLNTGFANRINNDHGISFDGKMIAISHHRDGLPGGGSTIYVLPIEGGTPKMVTEKTPSYWHGWSPNGKEIVYVAQREGSLAYDIYRTAVTGGQEIQLTRNQDTHVDGPEYAPDGKSIYYNGNQSGTMQIWRMKPDGSGKEQLTFDEYNNWFPHVSPDGKWIVFISFPPDIDVNDHPANKRVMLRLMPVSGGAPKVIAYLYGGQGTINVPSWSPDSQFISFVSYAEKFTEQE
ncbi:MAG: TolB family protein [Cyclobacteriaceae bacterium]|nr:TolB family protein [Cyclobacteriaceae bacterium]